MASLKSCTAWLFSQRNVNNQDCNDGTIVSAIRQLIDTRVADIIQVPFIGVKLENTMARIDGRGQNDSSSCACSSSSSSGDSDCSDEIDVGKVLEQKVVKVKEVNLGSFGHGFGLREDDIILTVNDKRVESTHTAVYLLNQCIAGLNKNSKLALEIQRKERGLIRLDNQGDNIELEEIEDDDLICVSHQLTTYRLKHLKYRKYLRANNGEICLSKRTTKAVETHFIIYQYESETIVIAGDRFVMIQHKASGQCICMENGQVILKDKPAMTIKLPRNSPFLFNLSGNNNSQLKIETITSPYMAIGFEKRKGKAVLLDPSNSKALFSVYEDDRT